MKGQYSTRGGNGSRIICRRGRQCKKYYILAFIHVHKEYRGDDQQFASFICRWSLNGFKLATTLLNVEVYHNFSYDINHKPISVLSTITQDTHQFDAYGELGWFNGLCVAIDLLLFSCHEIGDSIWHIPRPEL